MTKTVLFGFWCFWGDRRTSGGALATCSSFYWSGPDWSYQHHWDAGRGSRFNTGSQWGSRATSDLEPDASISTSWLDRAEGCLWGLARKRSWSAALPFGMNMVFWPRHLGRKPLPVQCRPMFAVFGQASILWQKSERCGPPWIPRLLNTDKTKSKSRQIPAGRFWSV